MTQTAATRTEEERVLELVSHTERSQSQIERVGPLSVEEAFRHLLMLRPMPTQGGMLAGSG